jgi:hypothetical protein
VGDESSIRQNERKYLIKYCFEKLSKITKQSSWSDHPHLVNYWSKKFWYFFLKWYNCPDQGDLIFTPPNWIVIRSNRWNGYKT